MAPHPALLRPPNPPLTYTHRLRHPAYRSPSSLRRFEVANRSPGDRWKLIGDIDRDAVQERLSSWFVKARGVLTEVTAPIVNSTQGKSVSVPNSQLENLGIEEVMKNFTASEFTVDRRTPKGVLSLAAVISIEQFARMNGLTGRKMHKIYEALAPEKIRYNARFLVEYGCFRYLSKDSSEIHPLLKDIAFQTLIFITMLAWQQPYVKDGVSHSSSENSSLQKSLVEEEAFVRIAPAVAGVADKATAHHLFKALAGNEAGISLNLWSNYITELFKVHQGRKSYKKQGNLCISTQEFVCVGSSRKQPVLKWDKDIAWPGNLILTNSALYFEGIGLAGSKQSMRLDLTKHGSRIKKAKVGPFRSKLFDSAVAVSSGFNSETWVLEFVDFGSETRRDVWHAFISEIISLYEYIREFAPVEGDPSISNVYGAHEGKGRVITSATNSIARLQCLQFIQKLSEDPAKLVQFSYLRTVPYGHVVLQALAVKFWGGPLFTKYKHDEHQSGMLLRTTGDSANVYDIDGSVYLCKWMRSPSWTSSLSALFWRNTSVTMGIILGRNFVVADMDIVERAAINCKLKSQILEKTQASIDAAMIKGIPSNIDLFKELMLPFLIMGKNFEKLRHWEEPPLTLCFLVFTYTIIFRNLLAYVLPVSLMILGIALLLLRNLREQGRLGRYFGKVTIRDQPPSNTIQKIVAVKEAMADFESSLQNINVCLLKIRTIILSGQPEMTKDVAIVLFCASTVLLLVPFRYTFAFLVFDLFTRELEFRREMVRKFTSFIKEKWASVQASPVVVLPYEGEESRSLAKHPKEADNKNNRWK